MKLEMLNLSAHANSWDKITLDLQGEIQSGISNYDILETDQIKFRLECRADIVQARLMMDGLEIYGNPIHSNDQFTTFEWMPRVNRKFGFDAFFLHYFGIAKFFVETSDELGCKFLLEFEPINVFGRRVTAQRAEAMLTYLSSNFEKGTIEALSPTSYGSSIVESGITVADILIRLERTLSDVDELIGNIVRNPISSLRAKAITIKNPFSDQANDHSIDWIIENSGLAVEASCEIDGLFQHGLKWRGMEFVNSIEAQESTDIHENQIVRFYLQHLCSESRRILKECEERLAARYSNATRSYSDYQNFYDVVRKGQSNSLPSYISRVKSSISKADKIIRRFDKFVPVTPGKITRITITEKLKSNRHYILFLREMQSWANTRKIIWEEKNVLSSINSIPKLFEYYTVLVVDNWLRRYGSNTGEAGLFDGYIGEHRAKLFYEPSYPSPSKYVSPHNIWATDSFSSKGRRPDIVIDINRDDPSSRSLIILDAKCRSKYDVISQSLPDCIPKYSVGIRDEKGKNPVKAMVLLFPIESESDALFHSFYKSPYDIYSDSTAYPIIGAQEMKIKPDGGEDGAESTLRRIISLTLKSSTIGASHS